jgi:hypothetical protein
MYGAASAAESAFRGSPKHPLAHPARFRRGAAPSRCCVEEEQIGHLEAFRHRSRILAGLGGRTVATSPIRDD